jgi:HK97 gp10 family phage protein
MSTQVFRVEGLAESEVALRELRDATSISNSTARNTIKRALVKSAQPIVSQARASAPVRSGKLKVSVDAGRPLSKRQRKQHTADAPIEVFVGAGPYPQVHMQEFGTAKQPPQRFLTPAVDQNINAVIASFSKDLADEVEKTAQRAARKLARIAKGNA